MGGCKRHMEKSQAFPAGTGSFPELKKWCWDLGRLTQLEFAGKFQRRESSGDLQMVTLESSAK